jgi:hypothetical protein
MSLQLHLSEKFSLPKEAVLWTFAFLAIRGAGKTYDAAKLAEQMLRLGYPIVVFDPMGIWWGLRVGVDGHEGFPVVIVGGQHQDLAIPLQSAKKGFAVVDETKLREMVHGILEAGLSVIVDTSTLSSRTQQTRTVAIFADELFKKNARYGMRHVFIEEADVYCPQKPLGETQASHTAIDNLVRRGGNFNLGCTMISQRSAVIDKDILSQANCLVALRILYVRDKDAIKEWVKNAVKNEAEMKRLAKWYDSLKSLKNGEAWLYSPEHNDLFEKIQFGQRETLHASREYFLQETWEQKNITLKDVTQFVQQYKAKVEPKPKVQESLIGPQPGVPVHSDRIAERPESLSGDPVVPTGNSPAPQTIDILRSNPVIQTQRDTISVIIPTLHPITVMGKLCVIMKDDLSHTQNWTRKRAMKEFDERKWTDEGKLNEAFDQLITLGILTIQSNRAYTFRSKQVEVTEKTINVIAP